MPQEAQRQRQRVLDEKQRSWAQAPPQLRSKLEAEIARAEAALGYSGRLQALVKGLKPPKLLHLAAGTVAENAPDLLVRFDEAFAKVLSSHVFRQKLCSALAHAIAPSAETAGSSIESPGQEVVRRQLGAPVSDADLAELLPQTTGRAAQDLRYFLVQSKVLDREGYIHGRLLSPQHLGRLRDPHGLPVVLSTREDLQHALGVGVDGWKILETCGVAPEALLSALLYNQIAWETCTSDGVLRQRIAQDERRRVQLSEALRRVGRMVDGRQSTHQLQEAWNQYLQEGIGTLVGRLARRLFPVGGTEIDTLVQRVCGGPEPRLIHVVTHALEQLLLNTVAEAIRSILPTRQSYLASWPDAVGLDLPRIVAALDHAPSVTCPALVSPALLQTLNAFLEPLGLYADSIGSTALRFAKHASWARWSRAAITVGRLAIPKVLHTSSPQSGVHIRPAGASYLLDFLCLSPPRAMIACFIAGENGGIVPHQVLEAWEPSVAKSLQRAARLINGGRADPTFRVESCDEGYCLRINPGQHQRAEGTLRAAHQRLVAALEGPHARLFGSALERNVYVALRETPKSLSYAIPIPAACRGDDDVMRLVGDFFAERGFRHIHPDLMDELFVCRPEFHLEAALNALASRLTSQPSGEGISARLASYFIARIPWSSLAEQVARQLAKATDNAGHMAISDTLLTMLESPPSFEVSHLLRDVAPHILLSGESPESVANLLEARLSEALPLLLGSFGSGLDVLSPHGRAMMHQLDLRGSIQRLTETLHDPLFQCDLLSLLEEAVDTVLNTDVVCRP